MSSYAYVGCRTTRERNACGNGIEVYHIDESGKWSHLSTVRTPDNPSYLSYDKTGKFLYAVHGDTHFASAYHINEKTYIPEYINTVELPGSNPVFLVPSPNNEDMIIACLGSGNIVAVQRTPEGGLGNIAAEYMFPGNDGIDKKTCPHQVLFDPGDKYLIVSLKGIKKTTIPAEEGLDVFTYHNQVFNKIFSIKGRNFDHCRQVAFHPNNKYFYLLNELQSKVVALKLELTGKAIPFQVVETLPDDCVDTGRLLAGTVNCSRDGKHLFASNRGHDSIAMFDIEQETGRLVHTGWVETQGKKPRFTCIDPENRYFYAANEESHNIVQFSIENAGNLVPTGEVIKTGSPTCIVMQ